MEIKRTVVTIAIASLALAGLSVAQPKNSAAETALEASNLAIAKLAAWENDEARKILEKNKKKYGASPEFQTAWALLEIQESAGDEASQTSKGLKTLDQASKNKDSNAAASFWEGEILYLQKKRSEADAAWKSAADLAAQNVKANPEDATAQFYRGAALVRMKEFAEARKALEKAENLGFDTSMVMYQTGLSFLFEEDWENAKKSFNQGLKKEPRFAPMYFWRAMAWEKLGRKDNMLVDLDQYLKLAPNAPDAPKAKAVLKSAGR